MTSHKHKTLRGPPDRAGNAPATPAEPTALLILGMHRSGTSALAGAVGLLGADLGTRLIDAAADNPAGYWEHADAVAIHEGLMHELESSWEDVRDLPRGWATSTAASRAKEAIESLIRDEFAGKALWAVKDPRLCRFVPLWLAVLHDLSIRPSFIVIARNPDEVARSLGVRDRIGPEHARLLWLRTMVDVEADTRGHARAMLSYDALLSTPVSVLDDAARRLGFAWPLQPGREQAVVDFLAKGHRHHHLPIAEAENAPGALEGTLGELFRLCRDGPRTEAWQAIAAAGPSLEETVKQIEPWVGGLMTAVSRARTQLQEAQRRFVETDAALGEVHQLSLSRLDEIGKLGARLAETQQAFEAAQALSIERLAQVGTLDRRLAATSQALASVEDQSRERLAKIEALDEVLIETRAALELEQAQSLQRLQQLAEFDRRLAETDAALSSVSQLSLSRLDEIGALGGQLADTQASLGREQAQSLERLRQLADLDGRLAETDAALREAEALSLQRLQQLAELDRRLNESDAAFREVEAQSLQRLQQIAELDRRLGESDAAFREVEAQSLQRLQQLAELDQRLRETDAALQVATALSLQRLAENKQLDAELGKTREALRTAEALLEAESGERAAANALAASRLQEIEAQNRRALVAEAELARVYSSRTWRMGAPLRWIGGRIALKSGNDPG